MVTEVSLSQIQVFIKDLADVVQEFEENFSATATGVFNINLLVRIFLTIVDFRDKWLEYHIQDNHGEHIECIIGAKEIQNIVKDQNEITLTHT